MSDKSMASKYRQNEMMLGAFVGIWMAIGATVIGGIVFPEGEIETAGYPVEVPESSETAAVVEEEVVAPIETFILASTVDDGLRVFRKCQSCHTYEEGGRNGTGPNLYDIIGDDIASKAGFDYSDALLNKEGVWDYERLSAYLEDPRGYLPGNRMAFAGLRKPEERGAVIAMMIAYDTNAPEVVVPMVEEAVEEVLDDTMDAVEEAVDDAVEAVTPE